MAYKYVKLDMISFPMQQFVGLGFATEAIGFYRCNSLSVFFSNLAMREGNCAFALFLSAGCLEYLPEERKAHIQPKHIDTSVGNVVAGMWVWLQWNCANM